MTLDWCDTAPLLSTLKPEALGTLIPPRFEVVAGSTENVPEVDVRPVPAAAPPRADAVAAGRSVAAMTLEE